MLLAITMLIGMVPPVTARASETEAAAAVTTVETTAAPAAEETEAPEPTVTVPAASTEAPAEETSVPTEGTAASEVAAEPSEETTAPTETSKETTAPTEDAETSEETATPTEKVTEPTEETVITASAEAADTAVASGTCGDALTWELDGEGTLTISGTGAMTDYSYYGTNCTPWYDYRSQITAAVVSDGVTDLGNYAFYNCTNLESVSLPDTLTSLGRSGFEKCYALTGIIIPEGVTALEDWVFEGCSSLTGVAIPDGVTSVGDSAFSDCSSLTSVTIPSSLTYIGDSAFSGCTSLTEFVVEEGNVSYSSEDGVLFNAEGTTLLRCPNKWQGAYEIPSGVTAIENSAFEGCESLTGVTIPSGVTSIGDSTFAYCTSLTDVEIPSGVTYIGCGAFEGCSSLSDIVIPSGVEEIYSSTFNGCESLSSVALPDTITNIGGWAFSYCMSLTAITIPTSVSSIDNYAFSGTGLTKIIFQGDAPSIGSYAFNGVTAAARYPSNNATWTADVMQDYGGTITWEPSGEAVSVKLHALPDKTMYQVGDTEIDLTGLELLAADDGGSTWVVTEADGITVTDYDTSAEGKRVVTISWEGMTAEFEIAVHAACAEVLQPAADYPASSHNYGDSIDTRYVYACPGAEYLKLTFSSSTETEENYDYIYLYDAEGNTLGKYHGTALAGQTVTVPGDMVTIRMTTDDSVNYYGFSLDSIYAMMVGHKAEGKGVYTAPECYVDGYTTYTCSICGEPFKERDPGTAAHSYADGFCTVCGVPEGAVDYGYIEGNILWAVGADGCLSITGKGEIPDGITPWAAYKNTVTGIVIGDGITYLGCDLFWGFRNLTEVTIAESVTAISTSVFRDCAKLTRISLPSGLTGIGDSTFYGCTSLGSITIPDGVTYIDFDAFRECISLSSITIPASVTTIGTGVFADCTGLKEIHFLGDAPATVESDTFTNVSAVVYYPADNETWTEEKRQSYGGSLIWVPETGSDVIARGVCGDDMTWVLGKDNVLTISGSGEMAFSTEDGMTPWYAYRDLIYEISLEEGITSLADSAFYDCTRVTEITVPSTVTYIDSYVFSGCNGLKMIRFTGNAPEFGEDVFSGLSVLACYPGDDATWTEDVRQDYGGTVYWVSSTGETAIGDSFSENLTWTLDGEGTLTIRGAGYMDSRPWESYSYLIRNVVIEKGVTSICSDAFRGCANLTRITIPETVTEIGSYAFCGCSALEAVAIPERVTYIGECAFYGCSALETITIPQLVSDIGYMTFGDCTSLRSIHFTSSAPSISAEAFRNVIANAYYPTGNTTWNDDTMQDYEGSLIWAAEGDPRGRCGSYATWYFDPDTGKLTIRGQGSVDTIYLENMETVVTELEIASGITGIEGSFSGCTALKTVTFSGNAPSFSSNAFSGVTATAYYPAGNNTWSEDMQGYGGTIEWVPYGAPQGSVGENVRWAFDPDTGKLTVTGTGDMSGSIAMDDCENLVTSVEIGEGITGLYDTFAYFTSLTSVKLPDSMTYIGGSAFADCVSLRQINLPEGLTSIGSGAFSGCTSLETIVLPQTLTYIDSYFFASCTGLREITIPASVTYIGNYAFRECTELDMVVFEGDAPTIGSGSFAGVTAVAYYPGGNDTWTDKLQDYGGTLLWVEASDSDILASGTCGADVVWVLDKEYTLTISGTGAMDDYSYDDESTYVPWYDYLMVIRSVVVEKGVTAIGNEAFHDCWRLADAALPEGLLSIGDSAFESCSALAEVVLPESLTMLKNDAFYCSGLKTVTIPANVTSLGAYAFGDCQYLEIVRFEGDAPTFGDEEYGDYVFGGISVAACYPGDNATWTEDVRQDHDGTVYWIAAGVDVAASGTHGENLTWELTQDGTLTIRGAGEMSSSDASWYGYRMLVKKIVMEEGITSVGSYVFTDFRNLTEVELPESLTRISGYAFDGCAKLAKITIPANVSELGSYAFASCSALKEIRFGSDVPSFGSDVFYGVAAKAYYPTGNTTWTEDACGDYGGCLLWLPEGDPRGRCGDYVNWHFDPETGKLTIYGEGEMWGSAIALENKQEVVTSVEILDGVINIGGACFEDCANLTSVKIADSVSWISGYAFSNCTGLTEITLPESISEIHDYVFFGCTGLTSISFPGRLYYIDTCSFADCTGLQSIRFNGDAPSMGSDIFANVTAAVYYPSGNTTWDGVAGNDYGGTLTWMADGNPRGACGEKAYWQFDPESGKLTISGQGEMWSGSIYLNNMQEVVTSVEIAEGITAIADGSFASFVNLTDVSIADSVVYIYGSAFADCTALAQTTIPAGVEYIGSYAFSSCAALQTVRFAGDAPEIESEAFSSVTAFVSYPGGNDTWTEEKMQDYGGTLFWVVEGTETVGSGSCGESLTWELNTDGTLTITGTGEMNVYDEDSVHVWERYRGLITKVVMEEGVTSIADDAFNCYEKINSVSIPRTVQTIGFCAFANCLSLTEITLPDGLEVIADSAFENCTALENVQIPESVTAIADYAFYGCTGLSGVVLPEGLASIGAFAFAECDSLTKITIPESVMSIGSYAFYSADSLGTIWFDGDAPEMGDHVFGGVTASAYYMSWSTTWTDEVMGGVGGSVTWTAWDPTVIASGVCGDSAYWSLNDSGVLVISGSGYFYSDWYGYENQIKEIVIRSGIVSIDMFVFENCTALTSSTIPATVEYINAGAFSDCSNLKFITFGHSSGDSLYMSDGFTNISPELIFVPNAGDINSAITETFGEDPDLYRSTDEIAIDTITLSTETTVIEAGLELPIMAVLEPWYGNVKLNWTVSRDGAHVYPDGLDSRKGLFTGSVPGMYILRAEAAEDPSVYDEITITVTEATGVPTSINILCLSLNLDNEVELGGEVQMVADVQPGNAANKEVTWKVKNGTGKAQIDQNGVLTGIQAGTVTVYATSKEDPNVIGSLTVEIVKYVENITILLDGEADVTQVGANEDYILSAKVSPEDANYQDVTWTVLDGSGSAEITYESMPVYTDLGDGGYEVTWEDVPVLTATSEAGTTFTLVAAATDGRRLRVMREMTVAGTIESYAVTGGSIYYNTATGTIVDADDSVTTANIPYVINGITITGIDDRAFAAEDEWGNVQENTTLTSVTIPYTVTRIGAQAFYRCTSLTGLEIAENGGALTIGQEAFRNCTSLANLTIPGRTSDIGYGAFYGLSSLLYLTVPGDENPNTWLSVGYEASLESLTVTGTAVADYAFDNYSVKTIVVSEGVTSIGEGAFSYCGDTTGITLPESLASIGRDAFSGCSQLQLLDLSAVPDVLVQKTTSLDNMAQVPVVLITATGGKTDLNWYLDSADDETAPYDIARIYGDGNGSHWLEVVSVGTVRLCCWDDYTGAMGCKDITIKSGVVISAEDNPGYLISGKKLQLTALHMPEGTRTSADWAVTSGSGYATVTSGGKVTALTVSQPVQVTITATPADGGDPASMKLWILPKGTSLSLLNDATDAAVKPVLDLDMAENGTLSLSAAVEGLGASNAITWTSSNTKVATVDGTGLVRLQAPGTVTITAEDPYGTTASVTLNVTYIDSAKALTAVTDIPDIGLQVGKTAVMQVYGMDLLDNADLTFTSSNEEVADVEYGADGNVRITAVSEGTAAITAKLDGDPLGRKAEVQVKVIAPQTETVVLRPEADDTAQLEMLDANGSVTENADEAAKFVLYLDKEDVASGAYRFVILPSAMNSLGESLALTGSSFKWATSNKKVATVKAGPDGSAEVTVLKGTSGACVITAVSTDLAKVEQELTIHVRDYTPRLESASFTLNSKLLDASAATGLVESYGNEIESVSLHEYNKVIKNYSDIATSLLTASHEDGVLTITANEELVKGTNKLLLKAVCENGETYEYQLKLTVKNTVPKITAKQSGKLNLFYRDSTADLTVTAKNAVVTGVVLADCDFVLTEQDGKYAVSHADPQNIPAKPDAKGNLLVSVEGYRDPVTKAVTISTNTVKPKLILTPASTVINTQLSNNRSAFFSVYDKTTGDMLDLTVDDVKILAAFGATYWVSGNVVRVDLTSETGGNALVRVQMPNWSQYLELAHKIQVETELPTAKLDAAVLKLNNIFTWQQASAAVILSQDNLKLGGIRSIASTAKAGTAAWEEAQKIGLEFDGENLIAFIADSDNVPKAGNYTFRVAPCLSDGTDLDAITVKVAVSADAPKVKAAASTLKLNKVLYGNETASTGFTITKGDGYRLVDFVELSSLNNEDIALSVVDGRLTAKLRSASAAEKTHSFTLTPVLEDEDGNRAVLAAAVKIKVQVYSKSRDKISVTLSAKGKLDVINPDSAIAYTVKKITNAVDTIEEEDIKLTGEHGSLFAWERNEAGQILLKTRPDQEYSTKQKYKVQFEFNICGQKILSSVLTVKVTQSALKFSAPKYTYFYQSQTTPLKTTIRLTAPEGATLSGENISINAKKSAAFLAALRTDGMEVNVSEDGRSADLTFRLRSAGRLTYGKSYTVVLDILPDHCASNLQAKPTQVKLTVKVLK